MTLTRAKVRRAAVQRRADAGAGRARRASCLARTMSGSRASGGGSSHQLAGRRRLLIRICFIGGPFCPVPGLAARTGVSRLGGGCSPQPAVTVSACDLPAAGHCETIGQRTPAERAARTGPAGPVGRRWRSSRGCGWGSGACQLTAPAARAVTGRDGRGGRAVTFGWSGRCGGMLWPPGSRTPVSANTTTPLQSRLHPCSGSPPNFPVCFPADAAPDPAEPAAVMMRLGKADLISH